jgi:hypothetical protein
VTLALAFDSMALHTSFRDKHPKRMTIRSNVRDGGALIGTSQTVGTATTPTCSRVFNCCVEAGSGSGGVHDGC